MFALQMSGTTVYFKAPSVRDLWRLLAVRRRENAQVNLCFSDSLHLSCFSEEVQFVCAHRLHFFFFSHEPPRERLQNIVNLLASGKQAEL